VVARNRREKAREDGTDHMVAIRRSQWEAQQSLPQKFLRFAMVRDRTGLSRSTIWRLERRGAFPRHRRLSANAVGWLEREVNEWLRARIEAE
jgi:prophage regulatory protein